MFNLLIAVIIDLIIGDPYKFPHPVKLMGRVISLEEKIIRKISGTKKQLKLAGFFIVIINLSLGFFLSRLILNKVEGHKVLYNIINTYLIYTCIAARGLADEAIKVYKALNQGIEEGRLRLSHIVGRDTKHLNQDEIIRATVETVAENTSDGVIGPLLYIMLLGAPGGIAYKFINTMDSMLGYMNDKYMDLGFFPAKTDDFFNLVPSRLTAILMNMSSIGRFNVKQGFRIMNRDSRNHKSPNSGYPESAVAGLLGIQLGGDSYYQGQLVKKPTMGDECNKIKDIHIYNTIEIMFRTLILGLVIYLSLLYIVKNCVKI